jgi:hypothetical protein
MKNGLVLNVAHCERKTGKGLIVVGACCFLQAQVFFFLYFEKLLHPIWNQRLLRARGGYIINEGLSPRKSLAGNDTKMTVVGGDMSKRQSVECLSTLVLYVMGSALPVWQALHLFCFHSSAVT